MVVVDLNQEVATTDLEVAIPEVVEVLQRAIPLLNQLENHKVEEVEEDNLQRVIYCI